MLLVGASSDADPGQLGPLILYRDLIVDPTQRVGIGSRKRFLNLGIQLAKPGVTDVCLLLTTGAIPAVRLAEEQVRLRPLPVPARDYGLLFESGLAKGTES